MNLPKRLLCCALAGMLSSTTLARVGETLQQCEQRYGTGLELPVGEKLKAAGVSAYEFRGMPVTVVAIIGSHEGVTRISYFGKGKFSQSVLHSLMKRNSPTGAEPSLWSKPDATDSSYIYGQGITRGLPIDDSEPRWTIGKKGDPSSLTAALDEGTFYSKLCVISYLKADKQARAARAAGRSASGSGISLYADELLSQYHRKLEASSDLQTSDQFVHQFIDEPTLPVNPVTTPSSSWNLDPTVMPDVTGMPRETENEGYELRNGVLYEHRSSEGAGQPVANHTFWLKGTFYAGSGTFEGSWGYETGGGENSAVVPMTPSGGVWVGKAATKKGHPVSFRLSPTNVVMSWGPRVEGSGERALMVSWPHNAITKRLRYAQ